MRSSDLARRRPWAVLAVVAVVVLAGAGLALRLAPSASTASLVGSSGAATEVAHEKFGDDAVYVLVRGDLARIVLTEDLNRLVGIEGCLSGNVPRGVRAPGACGELGRLKPVQVVYGPGTFINSAVEQITAQLQAQTKSRAAQADRAALAARKLALSQGRSRTQAKKLGDGAAKLVYAQFAQDLIALNTKYGLNLTGAPRLNDPDFVYQLVFDPARGARVPKARFAYLFPSAGSALISVRLKPGLSDAQRARAIELIRDVVRMPQWKLSGGASYVVTGVPVLADDLVGRLAGSTLRLLLVAVIVMAVVLVLVFRARLRLLPLAVALGACAVVFGGLSLLGLPLTLASIAVLPVLLGLVVDYAIQYQSRGSLPAIATAALSTAAGFLVLLLSPVPMVRGFGALLIVGVGVGLVLAVAVVTAVLSVRRRASQGTLSRSLRGASEILDGVRLPLPPVRSLTARVIRRPGRVVAAAFVLALGGWALDTQVHVVSDLPSLVPQDLASVRDLGALQHDTGVAGEVDVLVQAPDLTEPKVVAWMRDYQNRLLRRHGYSAAQGCGRAALCPALSLPDLFRSPGSSATRAQVRALLDAVPAYFSRAAITPDRRTAVLAFGIRLESLDKQHDVIQDMRASLHPPAGVTARLAGLPVLAADANHALADPLRRLATTLAGLLAVLLALLAVYRSWERAWVPLVPIAFATGWSALLLWVLGVSLNPLSAALGALVIAISTEFSVLLCARYRAERAAFDPAEALARTYHSTGAAVLASGVTAIAGFAVLVASDIAMLRDFGLVTVVDLSVSLLGVLAVLPAVLVLAERRAVRLPRRGRRRASVAA
ncbi:MMPL family transporter [Candidatus Solirubrobacter pratensis]|uniref:MMPL family transporter n=1 Tax=Candidatus Solirubrobacter pratensis TaxID=1298857 RepID=UPI0004868C16|nr:MMPL family transporter [Candidatus Solirubrobacter pratensis]